MPFLYQNYIARADLRANPADLFVFGDNLMRTGYGGQAREMRGEPNAVGIPTKRRPCSDADCYLADTDYRYWMDATYADFERLLAHVRSDRVVIWPSDGIGSGRADLRRRSPVIWGAVLTMKEILIRTAGGVSVRASTSLGSTNRGD